MALQIWLPLTGNTKNIGINPITFSNKGATVNATGRIGSCYSFVKTSGIQADSNLTINCSNLSYCFWFIITANPANPAYLTSLNNTGGMTDTAMGAYIATDGTLNIGANGSTYACALGSNGYALNTWVHVACVLTSTDYKVYLNGNYVGTGARTLLTRNHLAIGARSTAATTVDYGLENGKMNDFRLYDHCLSAKEVKEISKGLIVHYPMSTSTVPTNGYDILEYIQASGGAYVQTDYIANSINHKCEFKVAILSASGWHGPFGCYTSETAQSFRLLMKSGSTTEIGLWHYRKAGTGGGPYVAALTAWDQIIEGSMDSSTYIINNLTTGNSFTGNIVNDSSGTANTTALVINKSGPTATASNNKVYYLRIYESNILIHYYVPVKQKGTDTLGYFDIIEQKFWPRTGTTGTMTAGPVTNTMSFIPIGDDTSVYDASGYCHNGEFIGTKNWSIISPRYFSSQKFNKTSYLKITPSPSASVQTISVWAKWDSIPSGQSIIYVDQKSKTGLGLASNGIIVNANQTGNTFNKSSLVANTWYHFVIVSPNGSSNATRKFYINGIEQTATSNTNSWSYTIDELQIGKRSTSNDGFEGQLVDFRMYVTALSDTDIQELYNTSMEIDSNGNILPRALS